MGCPVKAVKRLQTGMASCILEACQCYRDCFIGSIDTLSYRGSLFLQVGALVEACKTYGAEARRLTPADAAEGVAQQFTELQHSLESAPVWQR